MALEILLNPLAVAIAIVSIVIADLTAIKVVCSVLYELTTPVTANCKALFCIFAPIAALPISP